MLKAVFVARIVAGLIGGAAQVQAAPLPPSSLAFVHNAPLKAEQIYWTRDIYGRRIWVGPPRGYYGPPPRYYRHRWWDGYRWRY